MVIIQDCRGRFASEGVYGYLGQEALDGYDAVEWAAALPHSSGDVGMFGGSYHGYTQWAAAALRPPHLRAIAPIFTFAVPLQGYALRGGAPELGLTLMLWLMMAIGETMRRLAAAGRAPGDIPQAVRGIAGALDRLSQDGYTVRPLPGRQLLAELGLSGEIDRILEGGPGAVPAEWRVPLDQVAVPSLHIGGWYDVFQQGVLDSFTALRARGLPVQLLMGPWSPLKRGGTPGAAIGEMDFGVAANTTSIDLTGDLTSIHLRWFDRWLRGADNGVDREPAVKVFVMGEQRWRSLPDWPPPGAREQAWYLLPGGGLAPDLPPDAGGTSQYTYNPSDPAPTLAGNALIPDRWGSGAQDQRLLTARADVLTFRSAPLAHPLTLMGRVRATLWAASTAPDTDFIVRLVDVHPDGFMHNLCDGVIRARYRSSLEHPEWLEPGRAYAFAVDLWSTAHVLRAGHCLAVQVTSSSFPRWDRNLNTRDAPGTAAAGVPAGQTVFHDRARQSCVTLPVLEAW